MYDSTKSYPAAKKETTRDTKTKCKWQIVSAIDDPSISSGIHVAMIMENSNGYTACEAFRLYRDLITYSRTYKYYKWSALHWWSKIDNEWVEAIFINHVP